MKSSANDDETSQLMQGQKMSVKTTPCRSHPRAFNRSFEILCILFIWLIWMGIGTLYFHHSNYGLGKSLYVATNVGYSIGWNYPEIEPGAKVFSRYYLAMGVLLLVGSVTYLIDWALEQNVSKYVDIRRLESDLHKGFGRMLQDCQDVMTQFGVFFIWMLFGTLWSYFTIGWSLTESFYFSLSSLCGRGFFAIPESSSELGFAVVGLFTSTGIPITIVALFTVVVRLVEFLSTLKIREALQKSLSEEDFLTMYAECIDPNTDILDENKLVLHILAHQRAVDIGLLHALHVKIRSRVRGAYSGPFIFSAMDLRAGVRSGSKSSVSSITTSSSAKVRGIEVFSSYDSRDSEDSGNASVARRDFRDLGIESYPPIPPSSIHHWDALLENRDGVRVDRIIGQAGSGGGSSGGGGGGGGGGGSGGGASDWHRRTVESSYGREHSTRAGSPLDSYVENGHMPSRAAASKSVHRV